LGQWRGLLSITDPALDAGRLEGLHASMRIIIAVETPRQAAIAAAVPGAILAARLSASRLVPGDDALGGLVDGGGHRESRFGVPVGADGAAEVLAAIAAAAPGRVRAVHVHHGALVATSPARVVATARAAVQAARDAGIALEALDLGGGLHGVAGQLEACFAALRAAIPAAIEVIVEPGRLFALGAGFAVGRIRVARDVGELRVRVVDLSRSCHLRWTQLHLVAPAPRPGEARRVSFVGPTCYEDDVLGDWRVGPGPDGAIFPEGSQLVLGGVTGYSLAWNTGFGGLPPAHVMFV
jgi:diaminopimelate decarboxylase